MDSDRPCSPDRPLICIGVLLLAWFVGTYGARDYAGSWNDGSRLAMVEALIDYHTLAIDDSTFVHVPEEGKNYGGSEKQLLQRGTLDKIYVNGHYYSDKSPAPALPMAAFYQVWKWYSGTTAREKPWDFTRVMNKVFGGFAYVLAVWWVFRLGQPFGLRLGTRLALTGSFALSTVALTYTRHVNNHILLLAPAAGLFLELAWLARETQEGLVRWPRLAMLGVLAGIAYGIDLGTGPVLFACVGATIAWRCRRVTPIAIFLVAALPGLITHHALNYAIGGTFKPANANPEYFLWPDCPFTPETMTGNLKHSVGSFLLYSASMLFGKRGFVGHNLPLFLALLATVRLLRKRGPEFPEVLCALAWAGGTWMAYALTSNNSSGLCCSIRWFVPLLAPAYFLLTAFLARWPEYRGDLLVLSGWGAVLSGLMWYEGPWMTHMVPMFWPIQAAALLSWLGWRRWQSRVATPISMQPLQSLPRAA